jgi:DNA integrity scanning protein DisA with diadenylate cyclase activity
MINKKLEEAIINVGLKVAKRGEGAIFVIGNTEYKPLVDQAVPPFNIMENPKLLESLAIMDGAVIINERGWMQAYGVMIKTKKTLRNFGTRHSAALAASKNNTVIMVSEEDKKVRILRNEKMVMQIDALQKNVEKNVHEAVNVLESLGAGTVGVIGTSLLVPALGITLIPGIIMFGSGYYIAKLMHKHWKGN